MKAKIQYWFKNYFEATAFGVGLILLALMNPHTTGPDFCLFDALGFPFCLGDGLGHSIAFTFRGDVYNALKANILGPFAIIILTGRILYLLFGNKETSNDNI